MSGCKRIATALVAFSLFSFGTVRAQEEDLPQPPEGTKIEGALHLKQVGTSHRFEVRGKTDLPEGVILRARLFALEFYEFQGTKRIDEEPVVYPYNETGIDPWQDFSPAKGAFAVTVNEFSRKPYSLSYRVRLTYFPSLQSDAVLEKLGDKPFSWYSDLRVGSDEAFKKELSSVARELDREFRRIADLFTELTAMVVELKRQKEPDLTVWEKFKEGWNQQLTELNDRNMGRYELWGVWIERQGKFRIQSFHRYLSNLRNDVDKFLAGERQALSRAQVQLRHFGPRMAEAREAIGVDSPNQPTEAREAFTGFREASIRLEDLAEAGKAPSEWEAEKKRIRRRGRESLVEEVRFLSRRGYSRLVELNRLFNALLKGCEGVFEEGGDPGGLETPLKALREARKDFEAYLNQ